MEHHSFFRLVRTAPMQAASGAASLTSLSSKFRYRCVWFWFANNNIFLRSGSYAHICCCFLQRSNRASADEGINHPTACSAGFYQNSLAKATPSSRGRTAGRENLRHTKIHPAGNQICIDTSASPNVSTRVLCPPFFFMCVIWFSLPRLPGLIVLIVLLAAFLLH